MKRIITPGIAVAVLLAAAFLTGCDGQDGETEPTPSSTSSDKSPAATAGPPRESTYVGTHTIMLDAPTEESARVFLSLTCISPGTLSLPDGAELVCKDGADGTTSTTPLAIASGQDTIEVTASDASVRYKVKVVYGNR